jgi:hypothetical protein
MHGWIKDPWEKEEQYYLLLDISFNQTIATTEEEIGNLNTFSNHKN